MKKRTLLVFAAGMGSRYGGLKQIDPVGPGGETIIDYSVYDALRAGFGKFVFVIRKDIEQPFSKSSARALETAHRRGICFSGAGRSCRRVLACRPAGRSHGAPRMPF